MFKFDTKIQSDLDVKGRGYPKGEVLAYIDGQLTDSTDIAEDGSFSMELVFENEGHFDLAFKQRFKEVTSEATESAQIIVDVTPPEPNLKVTSQLPDVTQEKSVTIAGGTDSGSIVLIGTTEVEPTAEGTFEHEYILKEGTNSIRIKLKDDVGNKTDTLFEHQIYRDTTKPKYSQSSFGCWDNKQPAPTEEKVCLVVNEFTGYDGTNYAPITGKVIGRVKSVKVENTLIKWKEDGTVNQRVPLYMRGGMNVFDVEVVDTAGNKGLGTLTVDWTYEGDNDYSDLEYRIEELEDEVGL